MPVCRLAAYAAAAGLNCAIITGCRPSALPGKRALETYGVELIVTANARERWDILRQETRSGSWYPATNYMVPPVGSNPYGVQGYKTVAYEIVEDLGAKVPDCIVVPTARGDLMWGILEGFRELNDLGQIGSIPRMYAVEPFPRIARVLAGSDYRHGYPGATRMSSIAGDTVSYQAVHAVKRSGGDAVVVTDDDVAAAIPHLAGQGFYCEASSAACLAALEALHRDGSVRDDSNGGSHSHIARIQGYDLTPALTGRQAKQTPRANAPELCPARRGGHLFHPLPGQGGVELPRSCA